VKVLLNGETRKLPAGATVTDLLSLMKIDRRRIAVEVNREIVPRQDYEGRALADGDALEIVHFVGGG